MLIVNLLITYNEMRQKIIRMSYVKNIVKRIKREYFKQNRLLFLIFTFYYI